MLEEDGQALLANLATCTKQGWLRGNRGGFGGWKGVHTISRQQILVKVQTKLTREVQKWEGVYFVRCRECIDARLLRPDFVAAGNLSLFDEPLQLRDFVLDVRTLLDLVFVEKF